MNAQVAREVVSTVEDIVKKSFELNVSWKREKWYGLQLAVRCLQFFSNRSQTSLKAGSFFFYPLLVILLNISEYPRRSHIVSAQTVCAYHPVEQQREDERFSAIFGSSGVMNGQRKVLSGTKILQTLCGSFGCSLEALIEVAAKRLQCKTLGRKEIFLHPIKPHLLQIYSKARTCNR